MNKKLNTLLFILGATVFNLLLMIILMVILFGVVPLLLGEGLYKRVMPFLVPILFIAAIVATFFIYNAIMKFVTRKIDMEKYFHPIFKGKR